MNGIHESGREYQIRKPGENDPDYITDAGFADGSGHYLLALQELITAKQCQWTEKQRYEVFAATQLPLGGYRPLPAARKFHRSKARFRHCLGGNRCLGPDTLIEQPDGKPRRVADIRGPSKVWAWDGRKRVIADASSPWIKGEEECFRVRLRSGHWFDASANHRLLTPDGYVDLAYWLKPGPRKRDYLVSPLAGHNCNDVADFVSIGKKPIYDLEVPGFSNYVSNGSISHNSSKSTALAVEVLWTATGLHPWRDSALAKPSIIWYCTTTQKKIADILWGKLDPSRGGFLLGLNEPFLGYEWEIAWQSKAHNMPAILRIIWPDKKGISEIHFLAYEQGREAFQGSEVNLVAFDEQFPRDVFIEATSRIGPGTPCTFASAFTPLIPDAWLEARTHLDIPKTDEVFQFVLDDQRADWGGFIEPEIILQTIADWPPEVRETRRNGRWGAYAGAIFQSFNPSIHVVGEEKERALFWRGRNGPGPDIQPVGVIDWGGANPFGYILAARIPHLDNDWFIFDELFWDYGVRGMITLKDLATKIIEIVHHKWQTVAYRNWADHSPTNINEFRNYGIACSPVIKQQHDTRLGGTEEIGKAGIEAMQAHLMPRRYLCSAEWPSGRPKLHIAERCKELIREIPLYRWSSVDQDVQGRNPNKKDAPNKPVKREDHLVDTCLVAGTMIEIRGGEKPIEQCVIGDFALTRYGWQPVIAAGMTFEDAPIWEVEFSDGNRLFATRLHLIRTKSEAWVRVDCLRVGDGLYSLFPNNEISVVASKDTGRHAPVYDLTIDGTPEFFANGILVHNCRYLLTSERATDRPQSQGNKRIDAKAFRVHPTFSTTAAARGFLPSWRR